MISQRSWTNAFARERIITLIDLSRRVKTVLPCVVVTALVHRFSNLQLRALLTVSGAPKSSLFYFLFWVVGSTSQPPPMYTQRALHTQTHATKEAAPTRREKKSVETPNDKLYFYPDCLLRKREEPKYSVTVFKRIHPDRRVCVIERMLLLLGGNN